MKIKTLILILTGLILAAGIALGVVYVIKMKQSYEMQLTEKDTQINNLQAELDSIGTMVTVYQTAYAVRSGTEIKEEDLLPIEVPAAVADQFIQNPKDAVGNFYLVDLEAGTPLIHSMILPFRLEDDMRYLDVVVSETPIGINVDDYVDVRIAFADGEDFLCMSNKRVAGVYGRVLKLIVNEKDIHVYESMKVDAACRLKQVDGKTTKSSGFINRVYAIKYVEGGAQKEGNKYYPIRDSLTEVLLRDPNITGDLSYLYNDDTNEMRKILDSKYIVTSDDIKKYKQDINRAYKEAEKIYAKVEAQRKREASRKK